MDESYEIFKTEKRFRSRNKLYFICKYYCFFQTKLFLIFLKQNFHPCICVYSNMMAKQWSAS